MLELMKLIKNKTKVLIICGLGVIIVGMNYKLIMTVILHPTQFDILVGYVECLDQQTNC